MDAIARRAELTTLVSALQQAGLDRTLMSDGPYTLFAPQNAAFEQIPASTRQEMSTPERRNDLIAWLGYHIVPGRLTIGELATRAQANGGSLDLPTVQGGKLTARTNLDGSVSLIDEGGQQARIEVPDALSGNGVVHEINFVLAPNQIRGAAF